MERFRDNIKKARDIALETYLDLKQILDDENPKFFHEQGMRISATRRFVNDISL
jgi:hypothetical protein